MSKLSSKLWSRGKYLLLALLGSVLFLLITLFWTHPLPAAETTYPQGQLGQAQQLYEAGQFPEAAQILEQFIQSPPAKANQGEQVIALRNLSLVYRQLGQWTAANEAIAKSLSLLESIPSPQRSPLLASVLDVKGSLQLEQGQPDGAVRTWERSSQIYEQLGDEIKANRSTINQAQALQQLGFYRRSITLLTPVVEAFASQPDSLDKSVALRSLGDGLQFVGELETARKYLEESLEIAQRLPSPEAIANTQLSLGNLWSALGKTTEALQFYQQAASNTLLSPSKRIQAQVNQLSLLVKTSEIPAAQALWPQIQASLDALPPSHSLVFARINLGQNLMSLGVEPKAIATIFIVALEQSRSLGDWRSESFALGSLGNLYEKSAQWSDAEQLTEQALAVAQTHNALYLAYPWQWQLGRIYKQQNQYDKAIIAYSESVRILKVLRADLITVNAQVQLSFQEGIDPIYRDLIGLLLNPSRNAITPEDLQKALDVFESLQVAELDNFFKEACLTSQSLDIDRLDPQAAVIYPIILPDRLELIVSFPGGQLQHYTSAITRLELEKISDQLRQTLLIRASNRYFNGLKRLYTSIIQPLEADLKYHGIKNLIFVLDGGLRNIPMAALYDGQQFLVQKYSVSLAPSLQLIDPRPLQDQKLRVLVAALSESRQGFSPLPYVNTEVEEIQSNLPSQVLLNQKFTEASFKQALGDQSAPIIHIATHGQFSSQNETTFILTWDERLDITSLNSVLQVADINQANPIELLVLSACETAIGDERAALGIAGMAVRSGARSTIATLWQVDDEATALFMNRFYKVLTTSKTTKTEALRQAQIEVLQDTRFQAHPYFWAPYVLVGNWL